MKEKNGLIYYKVFFGLLGLSAILTEIVVLVGRGYFDPANFFSYFTIQSNLLAATVLIAGAAMLVKGKKTNRRFTLLRGATTLYMVMTGVVFAILLSQMQALTAVPWDNTVLHYIMPVAILIDWFIDSPRIKLTWKRALVWLAFPLVYVTYSLIRGSVTGWYPYPFLNPQTTGYTGVIFTSIGITLFAMSVVWLLVWRAKKVS